jgi:predicted DNA-binding WGR domain protein
MIMSRYFEFQDKDSSKFWEITVTGKSVTVHYGKIGTAGQNTIKLLSTPAEANAHGEKVIGEKTKKGYKEKKK